MGTVIQDLRFGLRMMAKTPVVTAVAVLSLALGVAANASMFSILNAFLYEPLPWANQDRLVLLRTLRTGETADMATGLSIPNYRDLVAASQSIEASAAYGVESANLTGLDTPEQLSVVVASPSVFEVLGAQPALGRGFRADEGAEGSGRVLVLAHDFWERRFLGDRDVLGRSVTLDGQPYTIVGVMPEDFDMLPANVQALRPSDFADRDDRSGPRYLVFTLLRPGATVEQLRMELEGPSSRLAAEYPEANRGTEILAQELRDFFPGPTDTQLLKILTAVTLFGLLIACANIANLLLSRAEERQKEVAVRTALGAGRGRLLRQLLTESVVMAGAAGAVGCVLAVRVVDWLRTAMPPQLPRAMNPELDPEVLLVTLAVSVVAGVAFGMAPALHSVAGDLRESLGNGARGGTAGRRRKRLRSAFVVGEVAVAIALLSGAGFMIQAFERLANDEPGFEPTGLLTFNMSVLENRYPEGDDLVAYQGEILDALAAVPGVDGVAMMSTLPRSQENARARYTVDGRPVPEPTEQPYAGVQAVNAEYFETMQIPLLSGRLLTDADREGAPHVAVVSRGLARREFGDEDPLGRHLTVGETSRRIVGVVGDILQDRLEIVGRAGEQIYLPAAQYPVRSPNFALRASGDPTALSADVRQAVWSVEADQPVAQLRTLEAHMAESLAGPRSISLFLMAMGAIALALAAMGIYGVMAHAVTQQQRDIGIRLALGAGRQQVVTMVARGGLGLVAIGLMLGAPMAFVMFRGTSAMLNVFSAEIGFVYPVGLNGALLLVAVLATWIPARRASGVAPVAALKE